MNKVNDEGETIESLGYGVEFVSYPVVTAGVPRTSYDVRIDGETVQWFLYLDHRDQAKDLGMAFATGVRVARAKAAEKVKLAKGERKDWVTCPVCGESDMPKEMESGADEPGQGYITCMNLACASNGGDNASVLLTRFKDSLKNSLHVSEVARADLLSDLKSVQGDLQKLWRRNEVLEKALDNSCAPGCSHEGCETKDRKMYFAAFKDEDKPIDRKEAPAYLSA